MAEIFLVKRHGILMPSSESDSEKLATLTEGETIRADIKRPRNVAFHRKYFALLDVLFNIFEPVVSGEKWYGGVQPIKNRERFRKDIAIATGHYTLVVNIKNEVRAEADSISFASMDETHALCRYKQLFAPSAFFIFYPLDAFNACHIPFIPAIH